MWNPAEEKTRQSDTTASAAIGIVPN